MRLDVCMCVCACACEHMQVERNGFVCSLLNPITAELCTQHTPLITTVSQPPAGSQAALLSIATPWRTHTQQHKLFSMLVPLRKLIHYAQPHSIFVGVAVTYLQVCVIVSMCPFPEPDELAKTCNCGLTSHITASAFYAEGLPDEKECVFQSAAAHCCLPCIRSEKHKDVCSQKC